jgi:hypothetical protein
LREAITFRHDDPFWTSGFYPPLGYNCRCRVRPVSEGTRSREGIDLASSQGRLSEAEVEVGRGEAARRAPVARFEVSPGKVVATDPGFASSPADTPQALRDQLDNRRTAFDRTIAEDSRR